MSNKLKGDQVSDKCCQPRLSIAPRGDGGEGTSITTSSSSVDSSVLASPTTNRSPKDTAYRKPFLEPPSTPSTAAGGTPVTGGLGGNPAGILTPGSPASWSPTAGSPAAPQGTPAAGTPAAGTPVAGTPVAGTPVAGTPAAGTQAAGTPAAGTQAAGTQAAGTQAGSTTRSSSPVKHRRGSVFHLAGTLRTLLDTSGNKSSSRRHSVSYAKLNSRQNSAVVQLAELLESRRVMAQIAEKLDMESTGTDSGGCATGRRIAEADFLLRQRTASPDAAWMGDRVAEERALGGRETVIEEADELASSSCSSSNTPVYTLAGNDSSALFTAGESECGAFTAMPHDAPSARVMVPKPPVHSSAANYRGASPPHRAAATFAYGNNASTSWNAAPTFPPVLQGSQILAAASSPLKSFVPRPTSPNLRRASVALGTTCVQGHHDDQHVNRMSTLNEQHFRCRQKTVEAPAYRPAGEPCRPTEPYRQSSSSLAYKTMPSPTGTDASITFNAPSNTFPHAASNAASHAASNAASHAASNAASHAMYNSGPCACNASLPCNPVFSTSATYRAQVGTQTHFDYREDRGAQTDFSAFDLCERGCQADDFLDNATEHIPSTDNNSASGHTSIPLSDCQPL